MGSIVPSDSVEVVVTAAIEKLGGRTVAEYRGAAITTQQQEETEQKDTRIAEGLFVLTAFFTSTEWQKISQLLRKLDTPRVEIWRSSMFASPTAASLFLTPDGMIFERPDGYVPSKHLFHEVSAAEAAHGYYDEPQSVSDRRETITDLEGVLRASLDFSEQQDLVRNASVIIWGIRRLTKGKASEIH